MAIKPGIRKTSNKNPPFLSHEFIIQNHADIVSCIAMVFVVGLMVQATSTIASIFIALHHNVTGAEPSPDLPMGQHYTYEAGWKDLCAIFFYTLICIIMHAILQEYGLDKISKKLHLSKYKLSRFNESGQLIVFYIMSFAWGFDIMLKESYLTNVFLLWKDYPEHPMIFLHKLFFIIQLSYYLHMLPELYFQRIKKDEQRGKIIHALAGFVVIGAAYFFNFQRLALVLLTLHYFSEAVSHAFQLMEIFDRNEKFLPLRGIVNLILILTRFVTIVLSVLTLYRDNIPWSRGLIACAVICAFQGYFTYEFITEYFKSKRENSQLIDETKMMKKKSSTKSEKSIKRIKESDLPEADQNNPRKVKTK